MTRAIRELAFAAAIASIALGAGSAQAISSIDFVWTGSDTPTLSPVTANLAPGAVYTGKIVLTVSSSDPTPYLITLSLSFDTFELDFVQAWEYSAKYPGGLNPARYDPITAGVSVDEANGVVSQLDWSGNFASASPCFATCVLTLGTINFRVANTSAEPASQDRDIRLGLFTPVTDGVFTYAGAAVPVAFGTAAVPETAASVLLVAGIAFLACAGRRSNR